MEEPERWIQNLIKTGITESASQNMESGASPPQTKHLKLIDLI